jgi:hypothetical protein
LALAVISLLALGTNACRRCSGGVEPFRRFGGRSLRGGGGSVVADAGVETLDPEPWILT